MNSWTLLAAVALVLAPAASAPQAAAASPTLPVPDAPFPQEVRRRITLPPAVSAAKVRWIQAAAAGEARFFADGTWWSARLDGTCTEIPALRSTSPAEFVFPSATGTALKAGVPWAEVTHWTTHGDRAWLATEKEIFRASGGRTEALAWSGQAGIRGMAADPGGTLWVASSQGLRQHQNGTWSSVPALDAKGRQWAAGEVGAVAVDARGRLWIGTPAGAGVRDGATWTFFEGRDGLPYAEFTAFAADPGGALWMGTRKGAIRFDGAHWAYRQGPRWLPGDEVRAVAVDAAGTAWLVAAEGVGAIERRPMTLFEKAAHYEDEIARHILRTEYGYLSEVGLGAPGDRSKIIYSDSDNDGLWSAMYGAGECFAYAATQRPEFKERARKVFEALRFLQKVTQGGPHSPPKGYVARTIRPVEWPDPNVGRLEDDRRARANGDRLWKVYEPRWPRSADGKWYWKSDTSSDELDGHYFFYARYFDLVADDSEKERVREVVRDLTDHLVSHDFQLIDHDGQPTRWGVFGPQHLNRDPNWWVERGLNSLSMLSYLAVAEHITGNPKYGEAARELIENHGYAVNVQNPKTQSGPGSGNHSDDEMAFMCFYNLMAYSKETIWKEKWLYAFHAYAALELPELNPFFNYAYAAFGRGRTYSNPWGDHPLEPWAGWSEDSVGTLRDFPLDRVNWPHHNSHRLDLVALPPQQSVDLYEPRNSGRGHRVNGKVLPVSERHFGHWNTDPWRLDYGGDGRELASGTVFLLPYYMGLHHGFIAKP